MNASTLARAGVRRGLGQLAHVLRVWPWFDTLRTLRQRFREDRLGITASSLTFTTLIGLVPLMTVMLALFTAFPIFARFQAALQRNPSNQSIVWVKTGPEQFAPRVVSYQPLDGVRVAVTQGLAAGERVATQGAALINQVR